LKHATEIGNAIIKLIRILFFVSWLLLFSLLKSKVSVTLDRLLSILIQKWSKFYFNGYRPVIYAFVLLTLILLLNVVTLVTDGYMTVVNGTEKVVCDAVPDYDYTIFNIVSQVFGHISFCQFLLLHVSVSLFTHWTK
jgi:hypothetical protein